MEPTTQNTIPADELQAIIADGIQAFRLVAGIVGKIVGHVSHELRRQQPTPTEAIVTIADRPAESAAVVCEVPAAKTPVARGRLERRPADQRLYWFTKPAGLSTIAAAVLWHLDAIGQPMIRAEICREVGMSYASVNVALAELERRGIVERFVGRSRVAFRLLPASQQSTQ